MRELEVLMKEYTGKEFGISSVMSKRLGDIAIIKTGSKPERIDAEDTGYEYINAGTTNSGYVQSYNCEGDVVTTPSRGEGGIGYVSYQKNRFWLGPLCYKIQVSDSSVMAKYIYYYLSAKPELILQYKNSGGVPSVNVSGISKIVIEIPPIEVQQEIVRILDKFTELETELQAELDARKKQYEYYRETMLSFNNDIEIVTLDKCADIGTGSSNTIDGIDDGVYPFFVRSQKPLTMNKFEYDEIATITAGDGVGVGKVFHFIDGKYALHQRAYRIHITDKRINPKFFHYYFVARFPKFIFGNMYEGSVPSIRRPMLNKFEVPIPSMEEQNRIVDILDKFEEYCNNEEKGLPLEIEARHKQYEYYRDKLLTFERKVV